MLNDTSSLLAYFQTRRSGRPRDLVAPGPDADELRRMIAIAARTPDHGKLAPWRFVAIAPEQRDALATLLERAYRTTRPEAAQLEIDAVRNFAHQAPTLVVVLASPRPGSHIPLWEQDLSVGAATMNLLHAAHAFGFAAGWVTGWACSSDMVRDAFGRAPERITGFVFIGTPAQPLEERPRPDLDQLFRWWDGAPLDSDAK